MSLHGRQSRLLVGMNMSFASVLADKIVTCLAVTTLVLALVTFAVAMIW
jgi:hypothetical protein